MLLVLAVHVELPDVVDTQLFFLQLDLIGVGCDFCGVGADVVGKGGREEDDLERFGFEVAIEDLSEDGLQDTCCANNVLLDSDGLLAQTILIQHVVGFVKHKYFYIRHIENLFHDVSMR